MPSSRAGALTSRRRTHIAQAQSQRAGALGVRRDPLTPREPSNTPCGGGKHELRPVHPRGTALPRADELHGDHSHRERDRRGFAAGSLTHQLGAHTRKLGISVDETQRLAGVTRSPRRCDERADPGRSISEPDDKVRHVSAEPTPRALERLQKAQHLNCELRCRTVASQVAEPIRLKHAPQRRNFAAIVAERGAHGAGGVVLAPHTWDRRASPQAPWHERTGRWSDRRSSC